MRRTIFGMVIGFLTAATLAWALEVRLPTRTTAKATLVVNEMGSVLFGSIPARVEVTNFPTEAPALVVKDANGVVIGTPSRPVTPGSPIHVVRQVDSVNVEMVIRESAINGTSSGWGTRYYESAGCAGAPYLAEAYGGGGFYQGTGLGDDVGMPIVYVTGPSEQRTIRSRRSNCPCEPDCVNYTYPTSYSVFPFSTFDQEQFTPPYSLVAGP